MGLSRIGSLLLFAGLCGSMACNPGCKRTCHKLLDCGNLDTDRLAFNGCVADCEQQTALYETWKDKDKQALFRAHKRCLVHAECEEIAAGECYEGYEELFVFGDDETSAQE